MNTRLPKQITRASHFFGTLYDGGEGVGGVKETRHDKPRQRQKTKTRQDTTITLDKTPQKKDSSFALLWYASGVGRGREDDARKDETKQATEKRQRLDKTRQDKTKTRQYKTRQGKRLKKTKTRQEMTRQQP